MGRTKRERSYTERVHDYLDHDVVLQEMLVKGMLNVRKTARLLIAKMGWDCGEEAVNSAMRRWEEEHAQVSVVDTTHAIRDGDWRFRTGVQGARLKHNSEVVRQIYTLHTEVTSLAGTPIRTMEWLGAIRCSKELRAFVEFGHLDRLLEGLDESWIIERWGELAQAEVYTEGSPRERALAASMLLARLAHSKIDIVGHFSGEASLVIYAPVAQTNELVRLVETFTDGGVGLPGQPANSTRVKR